MSLVAFCPEEQVEACGEVLTLRLDFRAITIVEGALDLPMNHAVALMRTSKPLTVIGQILWALLREHHPEVTLDQAAGLMFSDDAAKIGFALDALLERAFPLATEDRKPKNAQKRRGRSKSSAGNG